MIRRWVISILGVVVALAAIAGVALAVVINAPVPKTSGVVYLSGPSAPVTIIRDESGVPHVYADTDHDLFFAQGYVHAQERFFQMDLRRHMTAGRLAELVGQAGVESDKSVRTQGWRKVAEQEWQVISAEARNFYEAYAAGVNAYIEGKQPWQLANEYAVLGLTVPLPRIEPWTGVDSLAWLKTLSASLSNSSGMDAFRARALAALGSTSAVEEVLPSAVVDEQLRRPIITEDAGSNLRPRLDYPIADPIPLPQPEIEPQDCPEPVTEEANSQESAAAESTTQQSTPQESTPSENTTQQPTSQESASQDAAVAQPGDATGALLRAQETMAAAEQLLGEGTGIGSNSFVISGKFTESGSPIISNDPHLMIETPSVWFQIGLHCTTVNENCTFDVSGFSFAGLPGVMIGRNPDLAWAFTNLTGDHSDLVIERNHGSQHYVRDGACLAYETRIETIEVAGGEPVQLQVRESIHGPIISDTSPQEALGELPGVPDDYAVALQWTALMPGTTAQAIFELNRAKNAEDIAAAGALFTDPPQNILFATASGDIGYQTPGWIPVRPIKAPADGQAGVAHDADNLGADGRWPRPGWDSSYDWQGFYAPSDLPATLNPPSGIIVTANQPVTYADRGPLIGTGSFANGYRAQQIYDYLASITRTGSVTRERAAAAMLLDRSPFAMETASALSSVELTDERHRQMQQVLSSWYADGGHNAVDQPGATIMAALFSHLAVATFTDELGDDYWVGIDQRLMGQLLADPDHQWWDDRTTPEQENADDIVRRAYAAADADLTAQLGSDIAGWQWGKVHRENSTHDLMGAEGVPGIVQNHFNGDPVPVGGGPDIPNASSYNPLVGEDGHVDFSVYSGASMRMVVDLSDSDSADWIVSSGVSGHPWSPYYLNQTSPWAEGRLLPWRFSQQAVAQSTRHKLELRPEQ